MHHLLLLIVDIELVSELVLVYAIRGDDRILFRSLLPLHHDLVALPPLIVCVL